MKTTPKTAAPLWPACCSAPLTQNWSAKLEYDHVDYFDRDVAIDDTALGPDVLRQAVTTDALKLGVNYRFGDGPFADAPFAPAADRAATGALILKAPGYKAPVAAGTWTGCFAGVHGGGGLLADPLVLGGSDTNPVPQSSGGFAGGQFGCDYQAGALVFGLEGEAAWSRIINRVDQSGQSIQSIEKSSDLVWGADGAVRAGVAIDRGLLYGKAGVAAGRFDLSFTNANTGAFENADSTFAGLLLGGGIEYALAPNWSVLLEYDRIAYAGPVVHFNTSGIPPFSENLSATVNEAKAGINYRFGGAALPPAASASQHLLPPPRYDWTGCYTGFHAGGGIIDDTFVPPVAGATARGAGGGRFDFFEADSNGNVFQGAATLTGLLLGLGVENAFAPNWSAKLEYDHVGYLSRNVDLDMTSTNESATTNTVKAGVNYKFFGPSGAIAARE